MPDKKAMRAYRCKKLNCAQSIMLGFQSHCGIPEDHIKHVLQYGGAATAEGRCGTLRAALDLSSYESVKRFIFKEFSAEAGSESCARSVSSKTLICAKCVELSVAWRIMIL